MKREESSFAPSSRCLAVFVDDTGHEELVSGHKVYGLGGCAALGRDIDRLIHQPWKDIRRRVTGSPDHPLHANKFARCATVEDIDAVAAFFRMNSFWRFGAIITIETSLVPELTLLQTMMAVLQARINDIVQMTLCKEIKIAFESSQRMDDRIEASFQGFEFFRSDKRIPVELGFMPKAVNEPALEVADFIMHAVGRQARHDLSHRGSFLPDFCAVFHAVPVKFSHFLEVTKVIRDAPSQ